MEKVSSGVPRTDTVKRFQRTNQVHLDLREPLTRQRAGIAEGRNSVIVEPGPDQILDVRFLLPEGKTLDVPAIGVVFSSPPGQITAPPEVQPEKIVVNRVEPNLAQTESALRRAAEKFGFDPEPMQRFIRAARQAQGPGGLPQVTRAFHAQQIGYLWLSMNARFESDDSIQINYKLYWGDYGREIFEETEAKGPESASNPSTSAP